MAEKVTTEPTPTPDKKARPSKRMPLKSPEQCVSAAARAIRRFNETHEKEFITEARLCVLLARARLKVRAERELLDRIAALEAAAGREKG